MPQTGELLSLFEHYSTHGKMIPGELLPVRFDAFNSDPLRLMWVDAKHEKQLLPETRGVIICSENTTLPEESKAFYIRLADPRSAFRRVLEHFFSEKIVPVISSTAVVDKGVQLGKNISLGENVVIEFGCAIGDGTIIGHNSVIRRNTSIGQNVVIGCNSTIGGPGFGYTRNADGVYERIPHIGNVIIEDGVEIGDNTSIDRAVMGSTIIRRNVRIDNQVHLAHGTEIGENTLVTANCMVAGSTRVGKNVWIAPSSALLNKISVGDDAFIGIGSVVVHKVKEGRRVFGNPASDLE